MSKEVQVYIADAFTGTPFGGNPAGIVIDQDQLDDREKQTLAAELKHSETAFLTELDTNIYRTDFFTPVEEVDLCGHATIASFYTLAKMGYIHGPEEGVLPVTQVTKAGKLKVYLHYKNGEVHWVEMAQPAALFGDKISVEKLSDTLDLPPSAIGLEGLEPMIVSTGIRDVMVPVKERIWLESIKVDRERMIRQNEQDHFYSYHVFTMEDGVVYQRNFCPILEIDEEAATGTATGALLAYLNKFRGVEELKAIQGLEMNRPSNISARYGSNGEIIVGGSAVIILSGVITL
ncbi:MAG: PhzF family phenazine biosynthesis protein [Tissierellia bacterium]|nr:PhzF family phenazine biosynthesis protein [Tissierellia bacterium]